MARILRIGAPPMPTPISDLVDLACASAAVADLPARGPVRALAGAPTVAWGICRHCNMSCRHCPAAATSRKSARDLTRVEVVGILDQMAAAGVRHVVWGGGEPLLRDDLEEIVVAARARGITSDVATNGILLAARARSLVAAGVSAVLVGLDGPRGRNDACRGVAGGFDLAMAGLRAARAAGARTGIRFALSADNRRELGATLDVAAHVDVDRFEVSHRGCVARRGTTDRSGLGAAELRAALLELFDRVAGAPRPLPRVFCTGPDSVRPLLVRWVAGRFGPAAADRVEAVLARSAGAAPLVAIDHRGRVLTGAEDGALVLGDLRRVRFATTLAHVRPDRAADGGERCGRCPWRAPCRGPGAEQADGGPCVLTDAEITPIRIAAGAE